MLNTCFQFAPAGRRGPSASSSRLAGLHHRQNAGTDRLGQFGRGVDHGGQVEVSFTSVCEQGVGNRFPRGEQLIARLTLAAGQGRAVFTIARVPTLVDSERSGQAGRSPTGPWSRWCRGAHRTTGRLARSIWAFLFGHEGGGGGIRTHGQAEPVNGFQDRPDQPLWHPSESSDKMTDGKWQMADGK